MSLSSPTENYVWLEDNQLKIEESFSWKAINKAEEIKSLNRRGFISNVEDTVWVINWDFLDTVNIITSWKEFSIQNTKLLWAIMSTLHKDINSSINNNFDTLNSYSLDVSLNKIETKWKEELSELLTSLKKVDKEKIKSVKPKEELSLWDKIKPDFLKNIDRIWDNIQKRNLSAEDYLSQYEKNKN